MDEVEVAVMLADISGSTALYETVGNVEALRQVSSCLDRLRQVIERHDGQFISSKGDDILCIFEDPKAALDVAMEMFESMQEGTIFLHAGVDFGPVIRARNDVFGDSVNMAARLATVANSGEMLCSQDLYDKLDGDYRAMLRFFGPRFFKGKTAHSNIYLFSEALPGQSTEVLFPEEEQKTSGNPEQTATSSAKAALRYAYETFICSAAKPVKLGRSPDCDVVVPLPWVSRNHATIDVRGDSIYLTDSSTSGTYVTFEGQTPILVRRDSILLHRNCTLSLSRKPTDAGAQVISCDLLRTDAAE